MDNPKSSILTELSWRGLIDQQTHIEELDALLAGESVTLYCGFDPSNNSLTIGNLVPMMNLVFFHRHGHKPIAVVGGATGRIGDPGGKSEERNLLSDDQLAHNLACIRAQMEQILARAVQMHPETLPEGRGQHAITLVNNADWMSGWTYLDFLRDVGKLFRVNTMMAKDSVRTRLENREQGISYTEFSYMLIQAFDFLHLFEHHGCNLQVGGSDQWGNITAGIDLIRKKLGQPAYGVTFPLLTNADGSKIGKTEKGAVWLDPERTSPFLFFQYWINVGDADVIRMLKTFTFLTEQEVAACAAELEAGQNRGQLQRTLAWEVTALIHGPEEADKAVRTSKMLFGESIEGLSDRELREIFADVPSATLPRERLTQGLDLIDLMIDAGAETSRGAARRLLKAGGVYLNNARQTDTLTVTEAHLATETTLVLRKGKKDYLLVQFA